jgi:hypothetical protein
VSRQQQGHVQHLLKKCRQPSWGELPCGLQQLQQQQQQVETDVGGGKDQLDQQQQHDLHAPQQEQTAHLLSQQRHQQQQQHCQGLPLAAPELQPCVLQCTAATDAAEGPKQASQPATEEVPAADGTAAGNAAAAAAAAKDEDDDQLLVSSKKRLVRSDGVEQGAEAPAKYAEESGAVPCAQSDQQQQLPVQLQQQLKVQLPIVTEQQHPPQQLQLPPKQQQQHLSAQKQQQEQEQEQPELQEPAWLGLIPSPQRLMQAGVALFASCWLQGYHSRLRDELVTIRVMLFEDMQSVERRRSRGCSRLAAAEAAVRSTQQQKEAAQQCIAEIEGELRSRQEWPEQQEQAMLVQSQQRRQQLREQWRAIADAQQGVNAQRAADVARVCRQDSHDEVAQRCFRHLPCDLLNDWADMAGRRAQRHEQELAEAQEWLEEAIREGDSCEVEAARQEVHDVQQRLQGWTFYRAAAHLEQARRRQLQRQQQEAAAAAAAAEVATEAATPPICKERGRGNAAAASAASDATAALPAEHTPSSEAAAAAAASPRSGRKRYPTPLPAGLALYGPFSAEQLRQVVEQHPDLRRTRETKAQVALKLLDAGVFPPFQGVHFKRNPPTPEQLQEFEELWRRQQQQQSKRQCRRTEPGSDDAAGGWRL